MDYKIIDVFSGIGGFSLSGQWAGFETLLFCEIDKFCQQILKKDFPGVYIHDEIRTLTKEIIDEQAKKRFGTKKQKYILTGGFPCQPFSCLGKRAGKDDDRYLWPEMLRIAQDVRPAWFIGENVAGLLTMENGRTFEDICTSLEDERYDIQTYYIPACGIGAWHRRDRIWIVAHNTDSK